MQLHLDTYGAYLHVREELFEIVYKDEQSGKKQKKQISAKKIKSIWMGEGTALSSNAVRLALENNVDIVFLDFSGSPLGRVWHSKLGSTTLIRKKQLMASMGEQATAFTKQWIMEKMENQALFLISLGKHRKRSKLLIEERVAKIRRLRELVGYQEDGSLADLAESIRGREGTASRLYFQTLSRLLPEQHRFEGRSFRPAKDAFNAFLNYVYGILYSRTEKALVLSGIDPFVGFFHRDDYNHKSMVMDFIEPFRIFGDRVVFKLFSGKRINKSHYTIISSGVRLEKEGKKMLVDSFNKHMETEKIRYRNRNQVRSNVMLLRAHEFAQSLLKEEL